MIEAWHFEHRPFLYGILRRRDLLRWVWIVKPFHAQASRWARLRATILVLGGHETEICCYCGGAVSVVWWCDDVQLWENLTGWKNGGGVACVDCFDKLAESRRLLFHWKPILDERVMAERKAEMEE